jgi:hypothetical protein
MLGGQADETIADRQEAVFSEVHGKFVTEHSERR